jgi:hypothetical protein
MGQQEAEKTTSSHQHLVLWLPHSFCIFKLSPNEKKELVPPRYSPETIPALLSYGRLLLPSLGPQLSFFHATFETTQISLTACLGMPL